MKELRHLHISCTRGSMSIGSHQIKLQTLENIWFEDWIRIDTVNFSNLHTSSIEENVTYSLDSMANLTSLQTLYIDLRGNLMLTIKPLWSCKLLKSFWVEGNMKDPSELENLPDSVTDLKLHKSKFTQDPMPTLERLSNLTTLSLWRTYMAKKMVCSHDRFPSLQYLVLPDFPNLEEWQVEEGAMPSLKGLKIRECEMLKMVSEGVKCIPRIPAIYDV